MITLHLHQFISQEIYSNPELLQYNINSRLYPEKKFNYKKKKKKSETQLPHTLSIYFQKRKGLKDSYFWHTTSFRTSIELGNKTNPRTQTKALEKNKPQNDDTEN